MEKDIVFLKHISESMELIVKYLKGISEKEFMNSTLLQDFVIRRLEIIGEATKNISNNTKEM